MNAIIPGDAKKLIYIRAAVMTVCVIGAAVCCLGRMAVSQEVSGEAMLIEVRNDIIELPGNQVSRVPLSGARFRSDKLRELNARYGAYTIERLYAAKIDLAPDPGMSSREAMVRMGGVPVGKILTKEARKKAEEAGKGVERLMNVYLIRFAPGAGLMKALEEYKALDVVTDARTIRVSGDE